MGKNWLKLGYFLFYHPVTLIMENCFGADNEKSGLSKDKKMGLAETDYDIVIVKIWIRFVPGSRQTMTTPKIFATSYYYRD